MFLKHLGYNWPYFDRSFGTTQVWWNGKNLHMVRQLKHSLDCVGYSFNFYFTNAHTCSIGFRLDDWWGQVSTSIFCNLSRIIIPKYDKKKVELIPFNITSWIHFLTTFWRMLMYRILLYLFLSCTHSLYQGSHTTTYKNHITTPCLIIWVTIWVCDWDYPFLTKHKLWSSH